MATEEPGVRVPQAYLQSHAIEMEKKSALSLVHSVFPRPKASAEPKRESPPVKLHPRSQQQQPTYIGCIKSPADAILLLAACDNPSDKLPGEPGAPPRRITRRLLDDERAQLIRTGSIFVWDEREAGMRRWTDGKCWSASRVSGSFLAYRELEMRKKSQIDTTNGSRQNMYKLDGLTKQSFSITTASNRKLHVISYFRKQDIRSGVLRRVSEDPRFKGLGEDGFLVNVDECEYGTASNHEGDRSSDTTTSSIASSEMQPSEHYDFRGVKRPSLDAHHDSPGPDNMRRGHEPPLDVRAVQRIRPRSCSSRELFPGPFGPKYTQEEAFMMTHANYENGKHYALHTSPTSHRPPYYAQPPSHERYAMPTSLSHLSQRPLLPIRYNSPVVHPNAGREYYYPPPLPPRTSAMEQDSIEALVSLRTDMPRSGQPPIKPFLHPIPRVESSQIRSGQLPVSTPDRDALRKLSVRV